MAEKLTPFNPAEGLDSDEAIAAYMAGALKPVMPVSSPTRWASSPGQKA